MVNEKAPVEPCHVDTGKAGLSKDQVQQKDQSSDQNNSQASDPLQQWWLVNQPAKPSFTSKELPTQFARDFEIIDLKNRNRVDSTDLKYALENPNFKGDRAIAIETLRFFDRKIGGSNDLDLNDMNKLSLENRNLYYRQKAEEADFLERHWNLLNTDGNKFISDSELKGVDRIPMSQADRAIAQRAKSNMFSLATSNTDEFVFELNGISRHDVSEYSLSNAVDKHMQYLTKELNGVSRTLYGEFSCNPHDAIKPEAIRQGATDDSVFLAGLASLAAVNPDAIQKMISVNAQGNYVVKFPGLQVPMIVSPPTDGELIHGANGQKYGLWPAVLEKAWNNYAEMQPRMNHFALFTEPYEPGYYGPDVMRTLTGREIIKGDVHNQKYIEEQLASFKNGGTPIIGSIVINNPNDTMFYSYSNGAHSQNSFSVVDYDPKAKMVTLRNTWGDRRAPDLEGQDATPKGIAEDKDCNGVFKISVEQFAKTMDFMYVAKK